MKKIFGFLFIAGIVLLLVALFCFKPLNTTPYQQTEFYKKEIAAINQVSNQKSEIRSSDTISVGWSSINLLPPFTTPIAIDANRGGKHFEGVHDSIYVRAFVFKQGEKKIAYISADLLIIPPTVSKMFDTILKKEGYDASNIFFTATHTHSSIGGWYNSYVGEKFAGKYDERVPKHIADCISKAILEAEKNCATAKIGYAEFSTQKLVYNRLVKDMAHLPDSVGEVDSLLRLVKIEKESGEKAAIITFAAHCTVFHEDMMSLSGDWGGMMMKRLNLSGKVNFCSLSAGAVGSHGPYEFSKNQETEAAYMAEQVAEIVGRNFDSIKTDLVSSLSMIHLPLFLRDPNLRITNNIIVRPWLFHKLFGDEKVYINTLQVGNIFFAGMPCDFSGELVNEIDSIADKRNRKLIVTSFNGGFVGYITDDEWYSLNTYETRLMNWFGPGNGSYFSEIVMKMLGE
ncbi:MAG: neutral/alkaline non-lysosomal ceramidase N-terminal domain-containing protein [Bacteroidota bacterium]